MKKFGCLLFLLVLSFMAIAPIGFGGTISGLQQVIAGKPGTFIMTDGKLLLMAWPKGASWGFAFLNSAGEPIRDMSRLLNGQRVDTMSMSEIVQVAEGLSWRYILPGDLPGKVTNAIQSVSRLPLFAGVGATGMAGLWARRKLSRRPA